MHVVIPVLALVCASLLACDASPQAKAVEPAPIVANVAPPVVVAPTPTPDVTPPTPPAPAPAAAEPVDPQKALLADIKSCVRKSTEEESTADCSLTPGVIGFHADGRVVTIMAPEIGSCGGDDLASGSFGQVSQQAALQDGEKTTFTPNARDADGSIQAWTFIGAQTSVGLKVASNIMGEVEEKLSGIRGVNTAAELKAPLAGWRLSSKRDSQIILSNRAIKASVVLGTVSGGGDLSIEQIVLNPERTHLYVLISFSDGSHCGSDPLILRNWPLPPEALATLK